MIRGLVLRAAVGVSVTAAALVTGQLAGSADGLPSGQVMIGNTSFSQTTGHFVGGGATIEPAYDDTTGTLVYLLTPNKPAVNPNAHNVAKLYLPVYPTGSTVGTLNCMHQPADNCPDHGPLISGLAESASAVYASGVLGHDHLVGIASTGGDFNVIWEPAVILFTPKAVGDGMINEHLTTLSQVLDAVANRDAFEIDLPPADFHCSSVSAATYSHGTPAPSAPPLP